ncbi:MAG: GNAT family N-acetyltransferase [Candidatus Coatesbacteria bacterium]
MVHASPDSRLGPDLAFYIHREGRWPMTVVNLYHRADKVSWIMINHFIMRVGEARLRVGGIGGVGTAKEHRNKGYSSLCMLKCLEIMERDGFHLTALFGIPNFYHRWGYAQAIPEPRLKLATGAAPSTMPAGYRIVPFNRDRHGSQVLALYAANEALRPLSVVRPPARHWRGFRLGSWWFRRAESFVVLRGGRVEGYGVNDQDRKALIVTEAGYRTPEVFPALAAEFAKRAKARRVPDMTLHVPPDHAYARYLRRFALDVTLHYWRNGDGMARIMCLEKTFRDCEGELTRRLRASGLARSQFAVRIGCELGEVRLAAADGRVRVLPGASGLRATIPQGILTQLLIGYRTVGDAMLEPGVRIPGDAVEPLSALFPPALPYTLCADRY